MSYVFRFSQNETDGTVAMKNILGGKGAGLAEMSRLGVPVPPGFTISTEACIHYLESGGQMTPQMEEEILKMLAWLEGALDKQLGGDQPLLLSVRSGARVSMPGMMDTILNLGLNDQTVECLAEKADARFAYDSYRRFIQMYGGVVLNLEHAEFEHRLEEVRQAESVEIDSEISTAGLKGLVKSFKSYVFEETGAPFPQDPKEQLWGAISAVFDSWNNPRAKFYRKINEIDDSWGTAVTVQSMVFGNMGEDCGTGVCFSRNPSTGEMGVYGEYLCNAQGEDVVAGIRTPHKIDDADDPESLLSKFPTLYHELLGTLTQLESHFHDMQDTEFTFESGKLYILQTRSGKRTSQAGLRIACEMCKAGMISETEAISKIDPHSMSKLLASEFDLAAKERILKEGKLLGKGLNAGPGAATGRVALDAELAVDWAQKGDDVILVRGETSPEDIEGMHSANGVLTKQGGMTSHAAVVARGMGKPCVVGCKSMNLDMRSRTVTFGKQVVQEGDYISIDGSTGEVILGRIPTDDSPLIQQLRAGTAEPNSQGEQFSMLMGWVRSHTKMGVRTNADTPEDAKLARLLGAQGIGLCRTEHMFFGEDRILHVRRMIMATDENMRDSALTSLLPIQEHDFYELLKAMEGMPVTIRLLDPPLHEFLPQTEDLISGLAKVMNISVAEVNERIKDLHESNPMLGHRGCRLGISHPTIYRMQVQAIVNATLRARAEGVDCRPEIMVPLIATRKELALVRAAIQPLVDKAGLDIPIGTMIEIPRAALTADDIANEADFFSFGTNDLTQCGMGLSRDDSASFLPLYLERGVLKADPFKSIDQEGIGKLVQIAVADGRQTKPDMKMGVCGEHGGDPTSVHFFYKAGLDYVSCSPFRVPVAMLAAAQASIAD